MQCVKMMLQSKILRHYKITGELPNTTNEFDSQTGFGQTVQPSVNAQAKPTLGTGGGRARPSPSSYSRPTLRCHSSRSSGGRDSLLLSDRHADEEPVNASGDGSWTESTTGAGGARSLRKKLVDAISRRSPLTIAAAISPVPSSGGPAGFKTLDPPPDYFADRTKPQLFISSDESVPNLKVSSPLPTELSSKASSAVSSSPYITAIATSSAASSAETITALFCNAPATAPVFGLHRLGATRSFSSDSSPHQETSAFDASSSKLSPPIPPPTPPPPPIVTAKHTMIHFQPDTRAPNQAFMPTTSGLSVEVCGQGRFEEVTKTESSKAVRFCQTPKPLVCLQEAAGPYASSASSPMQTSSPDCLGRHARTALIPSTDPILQPSTPHLPSLARLASLHPPATCPVSSSSSSLSSTTVNPTSYPASTSSGPPNPVVMAANMSGPGTVMPLSVRTISEFTIKAPPKKRLKLMHLCSSFSPSLAMSAVMSTSQEPNSPISFEAGGCLFYQTFTRYTVRLTIRSLSAHVTQK
ncbi:unnamed protein product [Protopolystoma xenopodis]|uniref:Uncharacterized protein n=1 Tax=Protopolystoma xenopodis TaxID=117903 RepID=A0A3S5CIH2_9PLAT|nr:unnamed protein product [Protopolystoma xenopodis]